MIGAIAGDVIGSVYEQAGIKTPHFELFTPNSTFTDDTILTLAIADAIMNKKDYVISVKKWGRKYPSAGYGGRFLKWLLTATAKPYKSYGNGSAMRVSPVGFLLDTLEEVMQEAKETAMITHSHPEGIKGAQATAVAIFMARKGKGKSTIKQYLTHTFGYDLNRSLAAIRSTYQFDATCQGSVPESIIAFLESNSYESAVRNAISLGGDADTMACIAGSIAEAFYGTENIPNHIVKATLQRLDKRMKQIVIQFAEAYPPTAHLIGKQLST
ncbi:MAG: ADP-ribosylglycohydrolase family protein [Chitinophagales bacterium]